MEYQSTKMYSEERNQCEDGLEKSHTPEELLET